MAWLQLTPFGMLLLLLFLLPLPLALAAASSGNSRHFLAEYFGHCLNLLKRFSHYTDDSKLLWFICISDCSVHNVADEWCAQRVKGSSHARLIEINRYGRILQVQWHVFLRFNYCFLIIIIRGNVVINDCHLLGIISAQIAIAFLFGIRRSVYKSN